MVIASFIVVSQKKSPTLVVGFSFWFRKMVRNCDSNTLLAWWIIVTNVTAYNEQITYSKGMKKNDYSVLELTSKDISFLLKDEAFHFW